MTRDARNAPARNDALDGLRALAALGVLTFHVWLYRIGDPPGARKSLEDHLLFQGNLGLICFFVLSGYLLYRSFARAALTGRRADLGGYARRRAARIVPAYYACVVGSLLLFAAVGYSDTLPKSHGLLFAVFGQNYSMDTLMKIDPVMWTLCVEAAFYVLLPLLGLAAFLLGPRRVAFQTVLLAGLVALSAGWNQLVHARDLGPIASKSLVAYIGHFALGMLVALWIERRRVARGGSWAIGPAATAGLMAAGVAIIAWNAYVYEAWDGDSFSRVVLAKLPTALGFALVVAAAAAGSGPAVGWLRARALVAVGIVSYGVYLWHLPLILVVRQLGLLPAAIVPRFAVVLTLALSVATLSWKLLERPLIERASSGRRRARALRPAEAQAAP